MKRLLYYTALASSLLAAYSCTEMQSETDATGYISINVEKNSPKDIIYVKSTEAEDMVIGMKIYDNVGDLVKEADDYTSMGTLELRTGFYRAVATSGTNVDGAGFDSPFYYGEKEFAIKRGQVSSLDIVCSLANIKVTVALSQDIKDKFSTYEFTVTGNDGSSLVYNQDLDNFSREGYFTDAATELEWSLNLVSKKGVEYKPITGIYTGVKPCQHYKFNFTLVEDTPSEDIGGTVFTIRLDDSVNQKDYDLNLDFGKKNPTVSSGIEDLSNASLYYGDPFSVSISSESRITSMTLSHDDAALEAAGLQRNVELAGADETLISSLANIGIITDGIVPQTAAKAEGNAESASIDFSAFLASLPKGQYTIILNTVNEDGSTETAINVNVLGKRPSVSLSAVAADEVWAMFAKVSGSYEVLTAEPEGLSFSYRKADEDTWTEAETSTVIIDSESKTFSAEIRGLQPSCSYVVKAVCADAEGPETTFTTETAATVPNMNFDDWYLDGEVWYPGAAAGNCFWDTANGGSKTVHVYPTVPEESTVISGKAAKLESITANAIIMEVFAAGNIYTGKFVKAIMNPSNPGALLDWGIPFSSRPLAIKGHYHYLPKKIDKAKEPYADMKGQTDIGQIQIMLTDWTEPFRIDTQKKNFVDVNDSHILAYGTMDLNETSGYQDFTINVEYRDKTKTPTYIVIVAAASKYGDYFTGAAGSTLYLDEFEFVYDPAQLD